MPPTVPSETREQKALMAWARDASQKHPELAFLAHVPNGEYRDWQTAKRLKALGVRPGFPDLLLLVPRGPYHGLAIELKRRSGGKLSEEQVAWHAALTSQGYCVMVANGAIEAKRQLLQYLALPAAEVAA